jgi:uncharacterized protein YqeY
VAIVDRLDADLKEALRARDAVRTSTIRLARAAIQNAVIDRRRPLSDEEVVAVLRHEVKRRREAIESYERGGRDDLVQREKLEMAILLGYLPATLPEDEIRALALQVVAETGASGERDFGRVMGQVMRRVAGRAEGKAVERIVREVLRG